MIRTALSCMALMVAEMIYAQTVMTVDRTEASIGDQVKATITTNLDEGREWRNLDSVWPDTMKGIEVVSGPMLDDKNRNAVRATWNIAVFDTGWVRIPALIVVLRQGNRLDTFHTQHIPIFVKPVEPDSTGLAPIKDIVRQPFSLAYYRKYIPHILIVLLIIAGLYLRWRKRQQPAVIPEEIKPEPLPHEWAMQALDDLEARKLWQGGEIKEHYSILTAILREYLERRYGIHALEQTSDEIIGQLRAQLLSKELLEDTAELLSVSDMIKFAKANPGMDIHTTTILRVRNFVGETMFVPPVEEMNDKTVTDGSME